MRIWEKRDYLSAYIAKYTSCSYLQRLTKYKSLSVGSIFSRLHHTTLKQCFQKQNYI